MLTEMKKTELDYKNDIMRKLIDIKNSQESLVEKIGHVQVDLMNHPDKSLEGKMDQMNADASREYEEISAIIEEYEMLINAMNS
jgi:hypothetical protein